MDSKRVDLQQPVSDARTSEHAQPCKISRPSEDAELLSQPRERIGRPEDRLAELEIRLQHKENEILSLQQRLSDLQNSATQARIANETLTYYLARYQRVKNRFLPPGSFR